MTSVFFVDILLLVFYNLYKIIAKKDTKLYINALGFDITILKL